MQFLLLSDCCQWNSYDVCLVRVKNQIKDVADYGTVRLIVLQCLGNSWRSGLKVVPACVIFCCLFVIESSVAQVGSELRILISQLVRSLPMHHHTLHTPAPPLLFHTWLPGHHEVEWFPHHVASAWTVAGSSQVPGITWLMQPSTWSNVPVTLYDGHCYPTPYIDTDTETWGLSIIHFIWSCRDLVSIPLNPVTVAMT